MDRKTKFIIYTILLLTYILPFSVQAQIKPLLKITGTAKGIVNGRARLIRYTESAIEKLGTDTIVNGKFQINFPVDQVSLGFLQIDGQQGGTVIVEGRSIQFIINENGSYQVKGGIYNQALLGYLKSKEFLATDSLFRKKTKGGDMSVVRGTQAEWEVIELFLRKEDIRSQYLENIMNVNPDPYVKVMAAVMNELRPDQKHTIDLINLAAAKIGDSLIMVRRARSYDKQQTALIARRQAGMLNENFVDFSAMTLKGDVVQLAPIVKDNQYTLLQFWASWCGPCRKEIPELKKLYAKYHLKGLEIVSFSLDDNRYNWVKASDIEKLSWYSISDLQAFKSDIVTTYPVFGIPANVIINKEGKIVASNLTGEELSKKVESLFH